MYYNLKKALEEEVGYDLNTVKACRKLEKLLYAKNIHVSYSTLNRMFNPAYQSQPRAETLNLLSQFLSYSSYHDFEDSAHEKAVKDELYFSKELEIKAYLLNNDYKSAIDLYLESFDYDENLYTGLTQILGNALFNTKNFDQKKLEYLLHQQASPPYFLEYFVYEDDLFGHYQQSLNSVTSSNTTQQDNQLFYSLFKQRKSILKGDKINFEELDTLPLNYHLRSRYFELKLYHLLKTNQPVDDYIYETSQFIIDLYENNKDSYRNLFYVGRWCRALIYSHQFHLLQPLEAWIALCTTAFYSPVDNIEFKAPIYSFLKLVKNLQLPLDFYKLNRWENAVVESQYILSIGLGNQKARTAFGKKLNLSWNFLKDSK